MWYHFLPASPYPPLLGSVPKDLGGPSPFTFFHYVNPGSFRTAHEEIREQLGALCCVSISQVTQIRVSEKYCSSFFIAICIACLHVPFLILEGKKVSSVSGRPLSLERVILFGSLPIIITSSSYLYFFPRPNWIYSKNPTIFWNQILKNLFSYIYSDHFWCH